MLLLLVRVTAEPCAWGDQMVCKVELLSRRGLMPLVARVAVTLSSWQLVVAECDGPEAAVFSLGQSCRIVLGDFPGSLAPRLFPHLCDNSTSYPYSLNKRFSG